MLPQAPGLSPWLADQMARRPGAKNFCFPVLSLPSCELEWRGSDLSGPHFWDPSRASGGPGDMGTGQMLTEKPNLSRVQRY